MFRQLACLALLVSFIGYIGASAEADGGDYGTYFLYRRRIYNRLPYCYYHRGWTIVYGKDYIPRCSSPSSYHTEQTRGDIKWCSKRDGSPIPYTEAPARRFPYDCEKIQDCPGYTVIETTARCDMTCEQALSTSTPITTFFCKDVCICPRGMYRNKDRKCVELEKCESELRYCPPPKVFRACGTRCPPTCAAPKPRSCKQGCNPNLHCMCPEGMVQYGLRNATCVKLANCPRCGNNARYTDCARKCPETCPGDASKEKQLVHRDCGGCKKGTHCMCPPGWVQLNDKSVRCIRRKDCPTVCPSPRVAKGCGTACPPTCDEPNPKCTKQCVPENICSCPKGYVELSKKDRTCVKLDKCPVKCEDGKVHTKCGSACPPTCDDPGPVCEKKCIPNTCECPKDFIQLSKEDTRCVFRLHCPVKCEAPKVYKKCATKCPPTCQDPAPAFCSRACDANVVCQCPPELVQPDDDTLTCIKYSDCPKTCEAPKVYQNCPSKCQPTCEEPTPGGECESGCFADHCVCPDGLLLHNNKCIKKSQCPKKCEDPKILDFLSPGCHRTCRNPVPYDKFCREDPAPEEMCVCPPDMYFLSKDLKKCVTEEKCQRYLKVTCEPPMVFSLCPEGCGPTTCKTFGEKRDACPEQCGKNQCVCPVGLILVSETDRRCVKPSDCPVQCESPKRYAKCPTKCPATCDNRNPKDCKTGCADDKCVCRKGFLLISLEDRTCVQPMRCPEKRPKCLPPKTYKECPSACPATCDNPKPSCTSQCGEDKCVCPEGTILFSLDDKRCVKPYQCPIKCDAPKSYAPCATKCPRTCAEPAPSFCSRACDANVVCVCPPDMVQLDKKNRTCVKLEDCPMCKAPKIFSECASKCRPTCQTPNPVLCDATCDPDITCVCPPGMVHPKNDDDSCIHLYECPESCEFPLQPSDCASYCPATCNDPLPKCEKGCKKGIECVCPKGLLQLSANNATCVLPSQCPNLPRDCPIYKEPTRCASGCPATCDKPKIQFCTKPCRPSVNCQCPQGMVQRSLKDDTCVWPDDCKMP